MTEFSVNSIEFLAAAIVVLFVGVKVNRKVEFLSKDLIPAAVTGGLISSLVIGTNQRFLRGRHAAS